MANYSNVYGTMKLKGDWNENMINNLNKFLHAWVKGICVDNYDVQNFSKEEPETGFSADGIYQEYSDPPIAYGVTLMSVDKFVPLNDSETQEAYNNLCDEIRNNIYENTPYIFIEFDEHIHQIALHRCKAKIEFTNNKFTGEIISIITYEYTKNNLAELGFCDDEVEASCYIDDEESEETVF